MIFSVRIVVLFSILLHLSPALYGSNTFSPSSDHQADILGEHARGIVSYDSQQDEFIIQNKNLFQSLPRDIQNRVYAHQHLLEFRKITLGSDPKTSVCPVSCLSLSKYWDASSYASPLQRALWEAQILACQIELCAETGVTTFDISKNQLNTETSLQKATFLQAKKYGEIYDGCLEKYFGTLRKSFSVLNIRSVLTQWVAQIPTQKQDFFMRTTLQECLKETGYEDQPHSQASLTKKLYIFGVRGDGQCRFYSMGAPDKNAFVQDFVKLVDRHSRQLKDFNIESALKALQSLTTSKSGEVSALSQRPTMLDGTLLHCWEEMENILARLDLTQDELNTLFKEAPNLKQDWVKSGPQVLEIDIDNPENEKTFDHYKLMPLSFSGQSIEGEYASLPQDYQDHIRLFLKKLRNHKEIRRNLILSFNQGVNKNTWGNWDDARHGVALLYQGTFRSITFSPEMTISEESSPFFSLSSVVSENSPRNPFQIYTLSTEYRLHSQVLRHATALVPEDDSRQMVWRKLHENTKQALGNSYREYCTTWVTSPLLQIAKDKEEIANLDWEGIIDISDS